MAEVQTPTSLFIPRYIDDIVFDAVLEETHVTELEITDHPIESGASVNDHVFLHPKTVSIKAYVSNHELNHRSSGVATGNIHDNSLGNVQSGSVGVPYGAMQAKIQAVYDALLLMQELGLTITVQTGLMLYENMAVRRLNLKQDVNYQHGIIFDCDLKQLIITDSQHVKYPKTKFYTKGTRSKKKDIIKTSSNQQSQRNADKCESKHSQGTINNTSSADDKKVEIRKKSALCKMFETLDCQ